MDPGRVGLDKTMLEEMAKIRRIRETGSSDTPLSRERRKVPACLPAMGSVEEPRGYALSPRRTA